MTHYVLRQLTAAIATLVGILTITFLIVRTLPGDPALTILGEFATEKSLTEVRERLGLDKPMAEQYWAYVVDTIRGDMGRSVFSNRPVLDSVLSTLRPTLALAVASMVVAIAWGVPAGVAAARRRGTWVDHLLMFVSIVGISFPVFWTGIVAILLFSHYLPLFPAIGAGAPGDPWSELESLVLPASVLGIAIGAFVARLTRSAMLEVLNQDFILVSRAMGLTERRIVYSHALRNAVAPIAGVVAASLAWGVGGAILLEIVFSRPGIGSLLVAAVGSRDYPVVQGSVAFIATAVVFINIALDLVYWAVDPRVRAS